MTTDLPDNSLPAENPSAPTEEPTTPTDLPAAMLGQPQRHASQQWLMVVCIAASFGLFWWAGELLGIPRYRGFNGSLLRQPPASAVIAMVTAVVLLLAVGFLAGRIARRFWLLAGPLAALAGLSAWSFRAGPSYYAYLAPTTTATDTRAFLTLAAECAILAALVAGVWAMTYHNVDLAEPLDDSPTAPAKRNAWLPDLQAIQVILTQAAFTVVGVILLVPVTDKGQAVFGLLAASMIAAGLTRYFHESHSPSRWIWVAPLLVGIAGYLIAGLGAGAPLAVETGRLSGTFAALARPLPIDYASAGVVGALLGLALTTHHWELAEPTRVRPGTGAYEASPAPKPTL